MIKQYIIYNTTPKYEFEKLLATKLYDDLPCLVIDTQKSTQN